MLPGRRTADGALFVTQGPPPAGTPLVGGIAVRADGTIYVSQAFTPPFSPLDLFASGEQGAWYDPSDLSTMSAGTTPVTADGQPVGLILDKSKGLVLGPELVTNGGFDTDTSWSKGAGTTISGGTLNINSASWTSTTQNGSYVAGKTYKITISISFTSGNVLLWINEGLNVDIGISGTFTIHLVAGATGGRFNIGTSAANCTIDNISIKELPGNHASQDTAAKRPLYKTSGLAKYNDYDVVDDVLNTTFPSSLGSSCTVAKAVVGGSPTILTGQTIGTTWAESTDNAGVVIVNRALTSQETTDLTAWLTAKGATA